MGMKTLLASMLVVISSSTIVFAPPFNPGPLPGPSTSIPALPMIAVPAGIALVYAIARKRKTR